MHHRALLAAILSCALAAHAHAGFDHLHGVDPYYPHRDFPKLTTPMWFGEPGVEAVVILSIDDMREPAKYEVFLRPVLDRLKAIDGRAPLSIFANLMPVEDPLIQPWLDEGLSIECHTRDHPCPLLGRQPFARSRETYDACVDLLASISNYAPSAFRMPCCDSLNTPSPRFYAEIFNRTSPAGNFLSIDTSVFNITTPSDPALPRELVVDPDGRERFRKYLPFPSFVNTIEDYPYPYVIGGLCWEFPCIVPSDWEGQNLNGVNAERTVEDLKAALDAVVLKQGVFTFVFHPHGWIRNDQVVSLIDHAVEKHGPKVRFITFREAAERLRDHLLGGATLRADSGGDNGVRLLDLNGDGFQDVAIANPERREARVWDAAAAAWRVSDIPIPHANAAAFGRVDGATILLQERAWRFVDKTWREDSGLARGLKYVPGARFVDLDADGTDELLAAASVFTWNGKRWHKAAFGWPEAPGLGDASDAGARLVDLDDDGDRDLIYSTETGYGVLLFEGMDRGWSQTVFVARRDDTLPEGAAPPLPPFAVAGEDRGVWFHSRHVWWQNEDTGELPDLVDRRSFNELLQSAMLGPVSPEHALKTMRVRPGLEVELVAAEPLVHDPVSLAWGPDGALWVAEMRDYPNGMDGMGAPGSRIVRLDDVDGDGRYDASTIFLDNLAFAKGAMPWRDGVLVACAPDILFAKDIDGDGKADHIETLFTGFGQGNQQHRVNGLRWGLDNWIYCANGDSGGKIVSAKTGAFASIGGRDLRFRPDDGRLEAVSGQTQFGRPMNDWGDWFGCANWHPGWHYALDEQPLARNIHFAAPPRRHDVTGETRVYPVSRLVARFNDQHLANHFTSACGIEIYRDDLLGTEVRGHLFSCEPVHNLVSRLALTPDGATYAGARVPGEESAEFLASTDNWFRPVAARTGPDGALYIADMYREVIEHPEYINERDQARSDFRAGDDRGRIYRVFPVGRRPDPIPRVGQNKGAELAALLEHPNGTVRDLTQQLLYERGGTDAVPALRDLARTAGAPWTRMHALGALAGLSALTVDDLAAGLRDAHFSVRRFALALTCERAEYLSKLEPQVIERAEDPDAFVRVRAAYTLGEIGGAAAAAALAGLIERDSRDPVTLAAALSSVNADNVSGAMDALLHVARSGDLDERLRESAMRLAARTAAADPDLLTALVELLAKESAGAWRFSFLREVLAISTGDAVMAASAALLAEARAVVTGSEGEADARAAAVSVLACEKAVRANDIALLCSLLNARESEEVVIAAVDRLRAAAAEDTAAALLEAWPGYSPSVRHQVTRLLLGRAAWRDALLAALETGAVSPRQIDVAHRQQLMTEEDSGIRERARAIFQDGANSDRSTVIERFRGAANLPGNAARGQEIFQERCAGCHQLAGIGHRVGPDLATVADRSFDALLSAVLDPNRAVEERYLGYVVATKDLSLHSGIVAGESANSIVLASQNGIEVTVMRSDIETMTASPLSPMPEGLEEDLTLQDMADLFSFVAGNVLPPKSVPGNTPALVRPDPSGVLRLSAAQAEIYGPTLTFDPEFENLGYWGSEDDLAVWEIEVETPGEYAVTLDYCCDNLTDGNTYLLGVAGCTLTDRVAGTGTWNQYKRVRAGSVTLPRGRHRLTFRSAGPLAGYLIDLRAILLSPP